MKVKRLFSVFILLILVFGLHGSAVAQTYLFSLDQEVVNVYMNADGSVAIDYVFTFTNSTSADPIDFVDVGLPNSSYRISDITADVDGQPITDIEESPYVTSGPALGLGANAIRPGQTGRVHVFVPRVERMFFIDETDENYASMQFVNTWFDSKFVTGNTDLTVTILMPPGLSSEEPRWQEAPAGFNPEPESGFDAEGRIFYTWRNPSASGSRGYTFGASVPSQYISASAIQRPPQQSFLERLGINFEAFIPFLFCGGILAFFIFIGVVASGAERRRKMQYLPPKISIGGHGIKRGLTAVEAAILLEQPMDKVMTMMLFSVLKKGVATVTTREPLELEINDPLPEGLRTYEVEFLGAFKETKKASRRKALQEMMINLVKSVAKKMKGFSKRETVNYYEDIMKRAWTAVEAADTPEVKSQKYDEVMEWTMLDRDFNDRTQDVFRTGPVFVPTWWHRYDPGFGRTASAPRPISTGPSGGGPSASPSLPTLPGSAFALNVVNGVQNFSAGVVGNITDFTSGITNKTNPPPPPSARSGGGGSSCACACAGCACACACAGGGR
jgi:hypothetical protein